MNVETCVKEWQELSKEFADLEKIHQEYKDALSVMVKYQKNCTNGIKHQRYRFKQISKALVSLRNGATPEEEEQLQSIEQEMKERSNIFRDMDQFLPHPNGPYLRVILGNVNVSLLNKVDKFKYKDEYETFKLVCVCIVILIATLNLSVLSNHRWSDALFHFILVWYYCTLTIRESILIVNGSRIKGWWVAHHYISTVLSGVVLIWPEDGIYMEFRSQFLCFSLWISVVNVMQYYYQKGSLYRLRALGERHTMDITVEGFQSWMWRGLTFLLPFLFAAYFFQLYNAYTLYKLYYHPSWTDRDWQVPVLAILFLILFFGNMFTMLAVVKRKIEEKMSEGYRRQVKRKYKMS